MLSLNYFFVNFYYNLKCFVYRNAKYNEYVSDKKWHCHATTWHPYSSLQRKAWHCHVTKENVTLLSQVMGSFTHSKGKAWHATTWFPSSLRHRKAWHCHARSSTHIYRGKEMTMSHNAVSSLRYKAKDNVTLSRQVIYFLHIHNEGKCDIVTPPGLLHIHGERILKCYCMVYVYGLPIYLTFLSHHFLFELFIALGLLHFISKSLVLEPLFDICVW